MRKDDIKKIGIKLASPEEILEWSAHKDANGEKVYGEVLKPETLNYRTQRPEKDGLFSERIFGPVKDYECYCGKYKKVKYKGIVCEKCGVEVTRSSVRRERMGHIKLATPVSHIWFLKTVPSRLSLILDIPEPKLEKVIYYAAYIVTNVNEENKKRVLENLNKELKQAKTKEEKTEFKQKEEKIKDILKVLKPGLVLGHEEYIMLSEKFGDVFEAEQGGEAIRKLLEKVDLKALVKELEKKLEEAEDKLKQKKIFLRLKLARSMLKANIRPEWMILTVLPVLPPDLRPMVMLDSGFFASADLNDLYARVINRNNRLKKLIELRSPQIIITNEKRMLQEAVDALIDNTIRIGSQVLSSRKRPLKSLADMLKGKQGRFRQNLLGKRVDYSGRSVIVVGPELKINECGIPKTMALELFKPFVIHKIISRGLAYNVKQANRLIEQGIPEVWAILEEVISSRRVLLNRAPTLHRLGIQAFKPVLIEDLCIRIPPLVCTAFNADFDGDQMGVHLPLTTEAQYEAKEIMDASLNLLKPADGSPVVTPTNDVILGIYWLTYTKKPQNEEKRKTFANVAELALAFEKGLISEQDEVEVFIDGNKYITSYGRVLFNEILPPDFSFVNEVLDKGKLKSLVGKIIERYDAKTSSYYIDKIKELGFKYSTLSSITWGIKDTVLVKEKKAIIEEAEKEVEMIESEYDEGLLTFEERKTRIIDVWMKVRDKISKILPSVFDEKNPLFYIVHSKSRGSWTQVAQMVGMKGLVQDVRGEPLELPVKSSYKEGLNVLEYFIGIHGSRKGLVDTALKTAAAGYLTRRMVDVVQDIFIQEEDCGSNEGIRIVKKEGDAYGFSFAERIFSRTLLEDVKVGSQVIAKKGEIITRELARKIEAANVPEIKVRSPITCKTEGGICATCYGLDLGRNKKVEIGETVGVIAAQSIGEPGTQLTLRTFHIGGVAGADITHGLPRVEEIFEARTPKGKAPIVKADGVVVDIVEKGLITSVLVKEDVPSKKKSSKRKKEENITEYLVPPKGILKVKVGDVVKKGDQICEGSLDLREILAYRGLEELIHYIINEIQSIYVLQGSIINDKHIEIIIRKMLSKVVIKEKGDSEFIEGEIVDKERFKKVALKLLKAKKKPPKAAQKIMGITRVALSTESFLSAASFQETSRVLVEAAVSGKVDELKGLKENVIIGRLIPAGTGKRPITKDELEKLEKELTGENNFGSLEDEKKE